MSVSTTERPAASTTLSPGPWEIGSGQRLDLTAQGLRTRAVAARVIAGR